MRRKKSKFGIITLFIKLGLSIAVLGIIAVGGIFAYYARELPSPSSIRELKIAESTKIYDRSGKILLYDIHGEQKRTIVPLSDIPQYMKTATLMAEDDDFYNHFGVDFKSMARAMIKNIEGQTVLQGGSTITQQLIKNIFLTPERTFSRKIKELILTLEMELKYSKDEILDFYLNAVPYGSNAYGVEAAAQTFFGKHARDITLAESALLASLTKATSYYSPFGSNTDELKKRQFYILERMRNAGYITAEDLELAKREDASYVYEASGIKAPHFVMYIRDQLEKNFGDTQLKNDGLIVTTTLDWELQQEAERIVLEWAEKNKKRFNAENAALVAIDPNTGQILAMVGSKDYFNKEIDGNVNVAIRPRQPGSSFKPFAYAKAFEKGYTPDTIVVDAKTNFGVYGAKEYIPENYDEKFKGPITLKEALAQSRNVPAVKVLYLAGLADTINLAHSMGITSLKQDTSHYGLSLVLGGGEVTLLEQTAAYGVFAQDGVYNKPAAILSIVSNNGKKLYESSPDPKEILAPQIARLITYILSNNTLRAPLFGVKSPLHIENIPSAAKSGTTQEYRDAWTMGYTPKIAVGVWVGNNNNSKMNKADGVKAAAPIWNEFMQKTYTIKQWVPEEFAAPEPINTDKPILAGSLSAPVTLPIDIVSGKIATEYTPKELIEEKTFHELHSILYYVDKDNPRGEPPTNPEHNPQFILWEEGVKKWVEEQTASSTIFQAPPLQYDDIHIPANFPQLLISAPQNNALIVSGEPIQLTILVNNNFAVTKIEVSFDDRAMSTISNLGLQNREYSTLLELPEFFFKEKGPHVIRVKAIDSVLNKGEGRVALTTQ